MRPLKEPISLYFVTNPISPPFQNLLDIRFSNRKVRLSPAFLLPFPRGVHVPCCSVQWFPTGIFLLIRTDVIRQALDLFFHGSSIALLASRVWRAGLFSLKQGYSLISGQCSIRAFPIKNQAVMYFSSPEDVKSRHSYGQKARAYGIANPDFCLCVVFLLLHELLLMMRSMRTRTP